MPTATVLTLDRDVVERFIAEVDALATFEELRLGADDTWFVRHVYRILDDFESAAGLRPMSDEDAEALHARGIARGREVFEQFIAEKRGDGAR